MVRNFRASDEGKTVLNADGDEIGTIDSVSNNRAYVMPKQGLSDRIRQRLGWEEDEETYELKHSRVADIAGDEVHLRK